MKRILIVTTALSLLAAPLSGAFAQSWNDRHDDRRNDTMTMQRHDDHRGNSMMMQRHNDHRDYRHSNWRKGGRIDRSDWNRGHRVNDWQRRHLQRPPRGYEWRQVDNNYVLAAAATGLIAALVMANSR
jgi:Ni/Co efflux regulator RcnB